MNNLEYLNQISRQTPHKKPINFIPILSILGALAIIITAIVLVINFIKNNQPAAVTANDQVYLRATNLNTLISRYNGSLRCKEVRLASSEISSVISVVLPNFFYATNASTGTLSTDLFISENTLLTQTEQKLLSSKQIGFLDREYANQINLQIILLLNLISSALSETEDSQQIELLSQLHNSLTENNPTFQNFPCLEE